MSLWKIAWRSIQQRTLASTLTALSMALGVTLVVSVLVVHGVVDASFRENAQGYDLIVGGKGGSLQMVLNTVFYLSKPTQNLPYGFYKEFLRGGRFSDVVQTAIPICMGDNYRGFRVIGTTPQFFAALSYGGRQVEFAAGKPFGADTYYTAVVGSLAARKTGLKVGDTFRPTHGIDTDAAQGHQHEPFTVVGVLAPTGTPNDRALFINIEGFYHLTGHAKEEAPEELAAVGAAGPKPHEDDHAAKKTDSHDHEKGEKHQAHDEKGHEGHHHEFDPNEPLPEELKEVTAILVRTDMTRPMLAMALPKLINQEQGSNAQAVLPGREIAELFDGIVGNVQKLLLLFAVLVMVVAGIGIMVSIYNSMSDRRHEIAVMRALGAGRGKVMLIVLLESILLSLGGGALGILLGHGLIGLLNPILVDQTGVSMAWFQFDPLELILIPGLIVLASLVGYLPAVAAYRTDVAKSLRAAP